MNIYRDTKTGAIIEIPSEIHGGRWVKVNSSPEPTVEVTEEVAETPVVKKKATRKATTK